MDLYGLFFSFLENSFNKRKRVRIYNLIMMALVIPILGLSQSLNIYGKISDANSGEALIGATVQVIGCLLYTSPSPRDRQKSRMPSSA